MGFPDTSPDKWDSVSKSGEMAEWSKAHAWKVCNRQKRFMGSNPILSAPKNAVTDNRNGIFCFCSHPLHESDIN